MTSESSPRTRAGASTKHFQPVSPLTDAILTGSYLATLVYIFYVFRDDWTTLAQYLFLVACSAVLIVVTKWAFEVFGRFISSRYLNKAPFNNPLKKQINMNKWKDQSWQLAQHTILAAVGVYVLHDETWFWDSSTCWIPLPHEQVMKPSLKFLYLAELAMWSYSAFSHRFFEERRKDYVIMFTHHICTCILIAGSYQGNYTRGGSLVLLIHDISDIPVDLMKMLNYLKLEGPKGFFISEGFFALNLFTWAYSRLWLYPTICLKTAFWEAHTALSVYHPGEPWKTRELFIEGMPVFWIANICMWMLQAMHVYWFFLLLRIGYKVLAKGIHEAGNEEYEGHSESDIDTHDK